MALLIEAAEMGVALACANVAFNYLDAADYERAQEWINRGNQSQSTHPNLAIAQQRLNTALESEEERAKELRDKANQMRNTLLDMPPDGKPGSTQGLLGEWRSSDGSDVTITMTEGYAPAHSERV